MEAPKGTFCPVEDLPEVIFDTRIYQHILNIIPYLLRSCLILRPVDMRFEILRYLTFIVLDFGNLGINDIRSYARAGFYLTHCRNAVCYCCGLCISVRELSNGNPFNIHRNRAPACGFVNQRNNIPVFLNNNGDVLPVNAEDYSTTTSQGPSPVTEAHEAPENIIRIRAILRNNVESVIIEGINSISAPNLRIGGALDALTMVNFGHTCRGELDNESITNSPGYMSLLLLELGVDCRQNNAQSIEGRDESNVLYHIINPPCRQSPSTAALASIPGESHTSLAVNNDSQVDDSNHSIRIIDNTRELCIVNTSEETFRKDLYPSVVDEALNANCPIPKKKHCQPAVLNTGNHFNEK